MQPPNVAANVVHRAGPPIGMPTTQPATAAASAADALAVRVEWVALERTPADLPPLISRARLIAAPRAAEPLLASGDLTRAARLVPAERFDAFLGDASRGKFGRGAAVATTQVALPPGITASAAIEDSAGQRLEIDIHRATTRPSAATLTAAATAATTSATTLPSSDLALQIAVAIDDGQAKRERALLDPQAITPPARLAVVFPPHFQPAQTIVVILDIGPPSDSPEHREALARCNADLQRLASAQAAPASAPARDDRPGLAAALMAMRQPASARAAMVYLADQGGAELLGDVALVAPDEMLTGLADAIRQRLGGDSARGVDPAQLGWLLDAAALAQLAALQSSETMPAELSGVLARYAGEAARNAGSIEELTRVRGREQLRARLIAENFTYLEDAAPSARVRAYDWLNARGRAPAQYDPLGPPRARAAAIDAAVTAAATQAATSPPPSPPPPSAQSSNTTGGAP